MWRTNLAKGEVLYSSLNQSESSADTVPINKNFAPSSFVDAALRAYNEHLHLTLRPDDVWIAIAVQFALYVEAKSEALRSKFVDFEGKKVIEVSISGSLRTANYGAMTQMFAERISQEIKDKSVRDWLIPEFSTTTGTDRIAGASVLMSALKAYFEYKCFLMCGLPSVTLEGTVEDWKKVRERAERLLEFEDNTGGEDPEGNSYLFKTQKIKGCMKTWTDLLFPVLDNLVKSAEGNPDKGWWNQICHMRSGGSSSTSLTGWITAFCVFGPEGSFNGFSKRRHYHNLDGGQWLAIGEEDLASGVAHAPVSLIENGKEYSSLLMAGHMFLNFNQKTTSIAPRIDWTIALVDQAKLDKRE